MMKVRKRVELLEESLFFKRRPDAKSVIVGYALRRLSVSQKLLLEGIAEDNERGFVRELTTDEVAAVEAGRKAIEIEYGLAGLSSSRS